MAESPSDRLRRLREAEGFNTAAEFAERHGLTESTYRSAENGTRGLTISAAKQYAMLLDTTWQYLLAGDEQTLIPVIGRCGAGENIYPFDSGQQWDPLPAPPDMKDGMAAVVAGDSMVPVYRDRDILFFERIFEDDPVLLTNRDCLVRLSDGRQLVKLLKRGLKPGFFRLHSYATGGLSGDVRIEWAAPVKWVQRAR